MIMSTKNEIINILTDRWSKRDRRFYDIDKLVNKSYPYPLNRYTNKPAVWRFKDFSEKNTLNSLVTELLQGLSEEVPQWDAINDPNKVIEEAIKLCTAKVLLTLVTSILMSELEKTKNEWKSKYNISLDLKYALNVYLNNSTITIEYENMYGHSVGLLINFYVEQYDHLGSGIIFLRTDYYGTNTHYPRITHDNCSSIAIIVPVIKPIIQDFLNEVKKLHDEI